MIFAISSRDSHRLSTMLQSLSLPFSVFKSIRIRDDSTFGNGKGGWAVRGRGRGRLHPSPDLVSYINPRILTESKGRSGAIFADCARLTRLGAGLFFKD